MRETGRRRHPLSWLNPDWFVEQLDAHKELDVLRGLLGERFLAFAWIAGVRFHALALDEEVPHASELELSVGEGEEAAVARMTVAELQRRLVAALVSEEVAPPGEVGEAPDEATLRALVGGSWLLLGPLYDLTPRAVLLGPDREVFLEVDRAGETIELPADVYRQVLRQLLLEELARAERQRSVDLDLARVGEAEAAEAEGRWSEVVRLLGAWPRYVAFMLRAGGGDMSEEDRARVAHALGLLGTALGHLGETERADEAFRVGLQWAAGTGEGAAASLFLRHGEVLVARGRYGQAIAPLRRALGLGAEPKRVLPPLARALLERGRTVAALGAVRAAAEAGADPASLSELEGWIERRLGETAVRWRRLLEAESS